MRMMQTLFKKFSCGKQSMLSIYLEPYRIFFKYISNYNNKLKLVWFHRQVAAEFTPPSSSLAAK